MSLKHGIAGLAALALTGLFGSRAWAGQPEPWQFGFQDAVTPVMERIDSFHNMLLIILSAISAFVVILLAIVIFRFNAKRNPTPRKFSHNTLIETLWTGIPIIILIVIAIPSFKLLYMQDRTPPADLTIKAIGSQWYWTYEYPDYGELTFDALMLEDYELEEGQPRLLATDANVVVPVGATVRVLVTATDVIHSWAVPAFGVKMDAVPGRMNETWFRADKQGIYYGQCSELCGVGHGFMPITVEVVSQEGFEQWIEWAQEELAQDSPSDARDLAVAAKRD